VGIFRYYTGGAAPRPRPGLCPGPRRALPWVPSAGLGFCYPALLLSCVFSLWCLVWSGVDMVGCLVLQRLFCSLGLVEVGLDASPIGPDLWGQSTTCSNICSMLVGDRYGDGPGLSWEGGLR